VKTGLKQLMNGHAAISPEMAIKLEAWLGVKNGGSAEAWLGQQMAYDLWQARQKVA
jgi:addiction module HigA family antidote